MGPILHIIRKEFLQILKDRPMLGIIFVMPVIQLFVLGYAITTDIKNISLVVVDHDRSYESRSLIDRFTHSRWFSHVEVAGSVDDVHRRIDRGAAGLALVIDGRFGEDIRTGMAPKVQLIVDGVDSNSALIAAGYARSIIMDHLRERLNLPFRRAVEVRAFYNPALESSFTIVPGILALLLTMITILLTALGLVREREIGTLEQLNVTPIRPIQLIIGKILPFAFLGSLAFAIGLTVMRVWFGVPMAGSYGVLALFTGVYLMSTLVLGMFVSTVTSTQQQAVFLAWFVLVATILMSGFMFPISNMPEVLQKVTVLIPLRYYITALRDILLKGSRVADLREELFALLAFGSAIFALSVLRFRKRM